MEPALRELDSPHYLVTEEDTLEGIAITTGVKVSPASCSQQEESFEEQRDLSVFQKSLNLSTGEPSIPPTALNRLEEAKIPENTSSGSLGEPEIDIELELETQQCQLNSVPDLNGTAESVPREENLEVEGGTSKILSSHRMVLVQSYLPIINQFEPWTLLYSLYEHGADITTFYNRVAGYQRTVIVVKTELGEVFGGYASSEWKVSQAFDGTGQSFLFKYSKFILYIHKSNSLPSSSSISHETNLFKIIDKARVACNISDGHRRMITSCDVAQTKSPWAVGVMALASC
jgi:TLD